MSTKKRRAAFDPNALNDLDDLLPPLNLVRDAAAAGGNTAPRTNGERPSPPVQAPTDIEDSSADKDSVATEAAEPAPETDADRAPHAERSRSLVVVTEDDPEAVKGPSPAVTAPNQIDDRPSSPRRADARRKSAKRDSTTTSVNRVAPPEVALPHEIYRALRSLTLNERSVDPTKARSYGQVVLDAIEEHAGELKAHWVGAVPGSGGGLFKRVEAGRPTRRRHNAPQSRVPLAGVIDSDVAVLDQLASDWGAGSRSALVEQALRLYLRVS